jgi:hypothetical protein
VFKILTEQFKLDSLPVPDSDDLVVLTVSCFSGLGAPGPDGQPQLIPIPTLQVQVPLDRAERARLRELIRDPEDVAQDEGESQPDGVQLERCGRLQMHPAHVWPSVGETVWCDGAGAMAQFREATNDAPPDAT